MSAQRECTVVRSDSFFKAVEDYKAARDYNDRMPSAEGLLALQSAYANLERAK